MTPDQIELWLFRGSDPDNSGEEATGKLVETVVPALVMAIAVFMILTQLHIAPQIVIITPQSCPRPQRAGST